MSRPVIVRHKPAGGGTIYFLAGYHTAAPIGYELWRKSASGSVEFIMRSQYYPGCLAYVQATKRVLVFAVDWGDTDTPGQATNVYEIDPTTSAEPTLVRDSWLNDPGYNGWVCQAAEWGGYLWLVRIQDTSGSGATPLVAPKCSLERFDPVTYESEIVHSFDVTSSGDTGGVGVSGGRLVYGNSWSIYSSATGAVGSFSKLYDWQSLNSGLGYAAPQTRWLTLPGEDRIWIGGQDAVYYAPPFQNWVEYYAAAAWYVEGAAAPVEVILPNAGHDTAQGARIAALGSHLIELPNWPYYDERSIWHRPTPPDWSILSTFDQAVLSNYLNPESPTGIASEGKVYALGWGAGATLSIHRLITCDSAGSVAIAYEWDEGYFYDLYAAPGVCVVAPVRYCHEM